jgi:hypothetical protein
VLFRAKFRDALRQTELFSEVPPEVWTRDWVVHCQPVGNGAGALKYLAPYIFRVAISNKRILQLENDEVTFGCTDAQSGQRRTCTVAAAEFIRRFLQHVLPKGFSKVRYYGFYSPNQREALSKVQQLLPGGAIPAPPDPQPTAASLAAADLQCPTCGKPMRLVSTLRPRNRCPP